MFGDCTPAVVVTVVTSTSPVRFCTLALGIIHETTDHNRSGLFVVECNTESNSTRSGNGGR